MGKDMQLLTKFSIGGQELKNRLVLAPLTRGRCTPTEDPFDEKNTIPNELMVEYYEQRASAGLVITEGTQISVEGTGWLNAPHIHTAAQCDGWKTVTDRVHAAGGVIYCQLWHLGRQSHSSFHPETGRIVSASAVPMPPAAAQSKTIKGEAVDNEVPHALTIEEIQQTVQDFVHAAQMAAQAGFDGIELHGANGYLLDQFFQSCTNQRTDQYGGESVENRARILVEIFDAIVASGAFPAHRIGVRLSPNGAFGAMGSADNDTTFLGIAKIMNERAPAYLHILDGLGFGFHGLCRALTVSDFRKVFDHPIICNVGLTKEIAEGMIRSGAADLACFGRLYMTNPDLPERFANDHPLNDMPGYETWWMPTGAKGYTDWPFFSDEGGSVCV